MADTHTTRSDPTDAHRRFVPYGRQWVDEDDVAAVLDVLRGDYLTTGPAVTRFEEALRAATGAAHALSVNSGTSALHTAYATAGIGEGDEIVTTPLTFAATANAAVMLGASVRFVDVLPDTGNIDPAAVARAITPRTRLIAAVDYTGHPADYHALRPIADEHGLTLVADAAHSLGAAYHGRPVGTLGDLTTLSFHPVKVVTTAEGGAVLTDEPHLACRAADFRTHGITKNPARLTRPDEGAWYYEMQSLGYNYRLSDLQAALGCSQMSRLSAFVTRRRQIAARYASALADIDGLIRPAVREGVEPAWHLYVVRCREKSRRRAFFDALRARGLGVQVHYIPVHTQPFYRDLGWRQGDLPVAEAFYAGAVSLPIFPAMSDAEVDYVIQQVHDAAAEVL
ncbi:MAG: UDP-4-amino-4,6-dideoxy-N-acetyl-beta-L-altrosamine transaminase [Phycisphaerae bacterium]